MNHHAHFIFYKSSYVSSSMYQRLHAPPPPPPHPPLPTSYFYSFKGVESQTCVVIVCARTSFMQTHVAFNSHFYNFVCQLIVCTNTHCIKLVFLQAINSVAEIDFLNSSKREIGKLVQKMTPNRPPSWDSLGSFLNSFPVPVLTG